MFSPEYFCPNYQRFARKVCFFFFFFFGGGEGGTVKLNDFFFFLQSSQHVIIVRIFNSEDENAPIKIVPYSEQKIINIQNGLSVASAYGQLSLNEITNKGKATSTRILINLPGCFVINSS